MDRPKIFVMVGLPGSGKSYQTEVLSKEYNAHIHSSDAIREELSDDINNQKINDLVFKTLHKRIKDDLNNGINCIYDACNISYKRRMAFLQELNKIPCQKICMIMATPIEKCFERNSDRDRKVPEEVIKRMYYNFNIPYWYEGWDDIKIKYCPYCRDYYGNIGGFRDKYKKYDQHNSHHNLSLGEHCYCAALKVDKLYRNKYGECHSEAEAKRYVLLCDTAFIHDCGKPNTATFVNSKGETTNECHYYNHEYAGAYDSLFYQIDDKFYNHLDMAVRIMWHMRPYLAWEQSEKAKEKDRKLLGDELFDDICLLHEADLAAH